MVEVKRQWLDSKCKRDINRLADLLITYGASNGGSIKCGIFAVFVGEWNDEAAVEKYKLIKKEIRSTVPEDVRAEFRCLPRRQFGTKRDIRNPDEKWWAQCTCGGMVVLLTSKARGH